MFFNEWAHERASAERTEREHEPAARARARARVHRVSEKIFELARDKILLNYGSL